MWRELRLLIITVAVGGGLIAIGFSFPPLTSSRGGSTAGEKFEAVIASETLHCAANEPGVDCACFGDKSAQVMAEDARRIPGTIAPDRTDLARSQARRSC